MLFLLLGLFCSLGSVFGQLVSLFVVGCFRCLVVGLVDVICCVFLTLVFVDLIVGCCVLFVCWLYCSLCEFIVVVVMLTCWFCAYNLLVVGCIWVYITFCYKLLVVV